MVFNSDTNFVSSDISYEFIMSQKKYIYYTFKNQKLIPESYLSFRTLACLY